MDTRMIFPVEQWRSDGGEMHYVGSYCFDTEHEARAFKDVMDAKQDYRSDWFIGASPVFAHASDAVAVATGAHEGNDPN